MQLRKRGNVWHALYYDENGKRRWRSTQCSDKRAATKRAEQFERDAADPDHAAANKATLSDALQLLLNDRGEQARAGRKSPKTVDFYRVKAGHLVRVFETHDTHDANNTRDTDNPHGTHDTCGADNTHGVAQRIPFRLAGLDAADVDRYISQRRREEAAESTIAKELVTLRAALKLARRRKIWFGDPAAVCPIGFAPEYKPRTRALSREEMQKLLPQLIPDHAARVAFIVATSACWGETERAKRADVDEGCCRVFIRGTKRTTRRRTVPVVSDEGVGLLRHALENAEGEGEMLFRPWGNVRRDLRAACKRAGIEPCSPNDLRRTFAHWLRNLGMPIELISPAMGHADTRMVERVYGRLPIDDLAVRMAVSVGKRPSGFATHVQQLVRNSMDSMDSMDSSANVSGCKGEDVVPRGGVEPPTRGFSVHCSTN